MKGSTRILLVIILITLGPAIVKLQTMIDPQRKQFQPGKGVGSMMTQVGNNPVVLPSQFVAGTAIGFREVVAGLLWVRVNDFFHSGQYEPIVPLTRMITWLDPHQIDVYCTGAWHLAYNFVDSSQRADHRYLSPAIKFLEEGVENNPGVWDPELDLGFTLYYLKAEDFEKAIYWIGKASKEEGVPHRVLRLLAHTYEKAGRIDECIRQWRYCVARAEEDMKKHPEDPEAKIHYDISKHNLDLTLIRKTMRADLGKSTESRDANFEAEFKKIGPRVFQISGRINLPDGARITVTLLDSDYKEPNPKDFSWEVDPNVTALVDIGIHGILVEGGEFQRKYDLSKDVKQYPFKKDKYILTLMFNPRTASDRVQDDVGWNGEGITDKKYLDKSEPGVRRIKKVYHLKREDII